MGKMFKQIVVGVAISLIGAAILTAVSFYVPTFAPVAKAIAATFHYLAADVTLPRWVFWLWLIATVAVVGFFCWAWLDSIQSTVSEQPQQYESDILFDLRWRWRVSENGWQLFTAFCPKCDNQLTMNDFQPQIQGGATYVCDSCSRRGKIAEPFIAETAKRAEREAQRRYRTGEWADAKARIEKAKN
jgi:hypothetical protein